MPHAVLDAWDTPGNKGDKDPPLLETERDGE